MHSELPSLVGRDHLSFRSYYLPIKVLFFIEFIAVLMLMDRASLMVICASNTILWIQEKRDQ